MTSFFRKVQEDSNGDSGFSNETIDQSAQGRETISHNPNWMLNRDEPPTLKRSEPPVSTHSPSQKAEIRQSIAAEAYPHRPVGMGIHPEHRATPQRESYQVPPQTIQTASARASFGEAPAPSRPLNNTTTPSNDQIRQMGFLQDNFREEGGDRSALDEDDWNDRQSPLNFVILASLIILLTVFGWFTYRWMTTTYTGEPPVILPEESPFKVKPENPGGMIIPHQDKLVYGRLLPNNQQSVEHLLPQPEQPMMPQPIEAPYAVGPQGYPQQGYSQGMSSQPGIPAPTYDVNPHQSYGQPQGGYSQPNYPVQGQPYASDPYGQPGYAGNPQSYPQQPVPYNQGYPQPYASSNAQVPTQMPHPQNTYSPQAVVPATSPQYGHPQPIPQQQGQTGSSVHPMGTLSQNQQDMLSVKPVLPMTSSPVVDEPLTQEETSEEEKQARDALDSLVADEIAGRLPPRTPATKEKAKDVTQPSAVPMGPYRLQIASFELDADAKNEIKRLKALDPTLFKDRKFIIQKSESSSTKKVIYKVMIGFFDSANQATQFKTKLKNHKVDGFVIKSKS